VAAERRAEQRRADPVPDGVPLGAEQAQLALDPVIDRV
jgi:hypothetical protein